MSKLADLRRLYHHLKNGGTWDYDIDTERLGGAIEEIELLSAEVEQTREQAIAECRIARNLRADVELLCSASIDFLTYPESSVYRKALENIVADKQGESDE